MSTQSTPQEGQTFTGEGIAYYQLATLKQALKLESKGLKSRGGALRPAWAAKLGLKPRDSYELFIAKITERMETILASKSSENKL